MSLNEKIASLNALDSDCLTPGKVTEYLRTGFSYDTYQASTTSSLFDCGGISIQMSVPEDERPCITAYVLLPISTGDIYNPNAVPGLVCLGAYWHRNINKVHQRAERWLERSAVIAERRLNGWLIRQNVPAWQAPWEPSNGGIDNNLVWVNPYTNRSHPQGDSSYPALISLYKSLKNVPMTPEDSQNHHSQPGQVGALQELGSSKEQCVVVNSLVRTRPELDGEQVAERALQLLKERQAHS